MKDRLTSRIRARRHSGPMPESGALQESAGEPRTSFQRKAIADVYGFFWGLYPAEDGSAWTGKSDDFGFALPHSAVVDYIVLEVCSAASLDNLLLTTGEVAGARMPLEVSIGAQSARLTFRNPVAEAQAVRFTFRSPRRVAPTHFGGADPRPLGLALTALEIWSNSAIDALR